MQRLCRGRNGRFKTKSGTAGEGALKLDNAAMPKTIDLSFVSGRHTGKTQPGISTLEGDTLRLSTDSTARTAAAG